MQIRDRVVELRRVKAGELLPDPRNWRAHPKAQREALQGILAEIGYAGALTARQTPEGLRLIDGHLRAETTPDTVVPVLVLDVTEDEAGKLLASLDPMAAMAQADGPKLDALLRQVQTESQGLADMYTALAEEAGILEPPKIDDGPEAQIDRAEELRKEWGTETGQLWKIGEHRLLCGDSTRQDGIVRVLAGERAECVFTDPPYGVSIGAKNRFLNTIDKGGRSVGDLNDDDLSPADLKASLLPAFTLIRTHVMAESCTLFVTAPQGGELGMMMMMLREAGLPVRHVLIWVKNHAAFSCGRLDYDYQHEPILLTWGKRHKRPMRGEHKTSVWNIDRPQKAVEHPTMKPVALYANAYLNNSDDGDVVYDAYAGSGTAFLAAAQTNRRCRAIEISPAYVAVTLQRCKDAGMSCELEA
jgi:16S rRNA G966 N2-methylase RsmD